MKFIELHNQYNTLAVQRDKLCLVCDAQCGWDFSLVKPVPHEKFEELKRIEAKMEELCQEMEVAWRKERTTNKIE